LTPLADIQDAVISRLQQRVTVVDKASVEVFPDPDKEFHLKNPVGAILVNYGRTVFGAPVEMLDITQSGRMVWTITCVGRSLVSNKGVLAMLDEVREILTGYNPVDGGQTRYLYPTEEGFLNRTDQLWWYYVNFEILREHRQENE
jgi:hypothetical protein